MSKLTTETLKEIIGSYPEYSDEIECVMARQLLAYEQAADRPVGEIFRCSGNKTLRWWNDVPEGTVLYAAPVLPKQPEPVVLYMGRELISKEGLELIKDGVSEATQLESMCMASAILGGSYPAQPVIPEEKSAIHRTKEPEDIAFNNGFAAGWNCCRSEVISLNETTAQPVSEPYKLNGWISVDEKMPEDGDAVLVHQDGGIIFCAEAEHGWFYPDEFPNIPKQGREITHWMPLPAAPAQESE